MFIFSTSSYYFKYRNELDIYFEKEEDKEDEEDKPTRPILYKKKRKKKNNNVKILL